MVNRTVVVGLDGATFKLIDQWMEEGRLPTLEKMCEGGVKTVLESCRPPVTSPAWKVFSTGLNPGNLGVFWWRQLDRKEHSIVSSGDSRLFDKKDVWNYLSDAGKYVGVVGVPLTFPPEEVNGAMVAGGPFSKKKKFTYPERLEERLDRELDYQHKPADDPDSNWLTMPHEAAQQEALDVALSKFDAAQYIDEKFDAEALFVATFYINALHHMLWDDKRVLGVWEEIDGRIGEFLDGETNVLLVSDHGMMRTLRQFYLGSWLVREGYCMLQEDNPADGSVGGRIYSWLQDVADRLPVPERLRYLGWNILRKLGLASSLRTSRDRSDFDNLVNYEESRAVAFPQGTVYLINCSEEEREKLREEIKRKLLEVRDEGQRVVKEVYERDEIYSGEYVEQAPDLYVEPAEGYRILQGNAVLAANDEMVGEDPGRWAATNHPDGILIACGPDISDVNGFEARLEDIAPTILHLHDVPVPKAMDGRVLDEMFREGSEPAVRDEYRDDIDIGKEEDNVINV